MTMKLSLVLRRAATLVVAGVSAIAAATTTGPSPVSAAPPGWTQDGYDAGNTGYNPAESVINAGTVATLRRRWSVSSPVLPASCSRQSPPVVAQGRLFLTDRLGIGAYDAATGRLLWRYRHQHPDDEQTPRLAVSGGLLIAANSDCNSASDPTGHLLALDAGTGARRWSLSRDAPMLTMVVDRGLVVVSGADASTTAEVTAYRVADGVRRWSRPEVELAAGVSAGGRLLLTRTDAAGSVAVSTGTGQELWRTAKSWRALAANPAGDRFLVADAADAMLSVTAATGTVAWSTKHSSLELATDGRRVYLSYFRSVEAYDARTGRRLWVASLSSHTGRPIRAGGLVYATVESGRPMAILHAATGRVAAPGTPFRVLGQHPVVAGGRLYVTNGSVLSAYAP